MINGERAAAVLIVAAYALGIAVLFYVSQL
jgi:hypothetical protein